MILLSQYVFVGLVSHLVVLIVGIGGVAGVVPLPRGRRSGLGLCLMAVAMALLVLAPGWRLGWWGSAGYLALSAAGL